MTHSLRGRLLISLAIVIVLTGVTAGLVAFRWAFDEAIEFQDSILLQVGTIAEEVHMPGSVRASGKLEPEAQVLVEDLTNAVDKTSLLPLPDGLHSISRAGQQWRLLIRTRPDGGRMLIGQPIYIRDRIAMDSALHSVIPLLVLIPCLMVVVAVVTRQTLMPISRLAEQLDAGQVDRLETLSLKDTPSELHPFIHSINRLLGRVQTLIDRQRRFIADAAHELRTPITAISLQAENLDQIELAPENRNRLSALKSGTRRTAHLLEQLLSLARYDMGPRPEDSVSFLDRCAKDVVAEAMPRARDEEIDLGFDSINSVSIHGDSMMISVIIRNLLDNSLRHTPQGGRVDIKVQKSNEWAILMVEDTGPGIPEADLDRIFEPFVRGSHPVDGGTGLGLSIVSRIVERLGGSIILQNIAASDRSGLRATVKLPAYD
jgi:two-component system OmpR family sensor kinase